MTMKAVITGATSGIGREIARGLVREGATVIVGARNIDKGEALREDLAVDANDHNRIEIMPFDAADMTSVRAFAAAVAARHPELNLMINNAGAWFNERRLTREGHESTLAINTLAPHLLTRLLLPQLRMGKPARIINIVSSAGGNYDPTDFGWQQRKYDGFKAYTQSKQALRMATWKMAQRVTGTGITANAVSPGFVRTAFLQNAKGPVATLLNLIRVLAVTPEKGAATPLWAALSPALESANGKYFENLKEKEGKFRDQPSLDQLEAILDEMTGVASDTVD